MSLRFAGLEDRKTREQDEFQDLAKHVGRYQDERVKVLEFLSPTFTLHFEITIYNGERSNLQSLVKSMTQYPAVLALLWVAVFRLLSG